MRRGGLCTALSALLAVIACVTAQVDDVAEGTVESYTAGSGRALKATGPGSTFGFGIPTKCHRRNYGSPYRVYVDSFLPGETATVIELSIITASTCAVPNAACCKEDLDHLLLKTALNITVSSVTVDNSPVPVSMTSKGIKMDLALTANKIGRTGVRMTISTSGVTRLLEVCPDTRIPGTCDYIAYNLAETCCPTSNTISTPPEYLGGSSGGTGSTRDAPSPPPSPPAPPPFPPPPPPFDTVCCVDDENRSPYFMRFVAGKQSAGGMVYEFQLAAKSPAELVNAYRDYDGNERVSDCMETGIWQLRLSVGSDIVPTAVWLNDAPLALNRFRTEPQTNPSQQWLIITLNLALSDVQLGPWEMAIVVQQTAAVPSTVPLDTVQGLCPTVNAMRASVDSCQANDAQYAFGHVCEYVIQGYSPSGQSCCPRSVTKRWIPDKECCIDKTLVQPYIVKALGKKVNVVLNAGDVPTTTFLYDISARSNLPYDASCRNMSVDSLELKIYGALVVKEARVNGQPHLIAENSVSPASKWVEILGLSRYVWQFGNLPRISVEVEVFGRPAYLCPFTQQQLMGDVSKCIPSGSSACEFALHGRDGCEQCCPHGFAQFLDCPVNNTLDYPQCECNDDYMTDYMIKLVGATRTAQPFGSVAAKPVQTEFAFMLDMMAMSRLHGDFDDFLGIDVVSSQGGCSKVRLNRLHIVIYRHLKVQAVYIQGLHGLPATTRNFRVVPYGYNSAQLQIFDLEIFYQMAEEMADGIPTLLIAVSGFAETLCPAAKELRSSPACEMTVFDDSQPWCCPHVFTSTDAALHVRRRATLQATAATAHMTI